MKKSLDEMIEEARQREISAREEIEILEREKQKQDTLKALPQIGNTMRWSEGVLTVNRIEFAEDGTPLFGFSPRISQTARPARRNRTTQPNAAIVRVVKDESPKAPTPPFQTMNEQTKLFSEDNVAKPNRKLAAVIAQFKKHFIERDGILYHAQGKRKGEIAGWKNTSGMWCVSVKNVEWYRRDVVYLLRNEQLPETELEYVNGDRLDDRIENLRVSKRKRRHRRISSDRAKIISRVTQKTA